MAHASLAIPPIDSIVFYGAVEASYKPRKDDIPNNNFTDASLDGGKSIYYIYPDINQSGHATPSTIQILEDSTKQCLTVKPPKSCKGFSKKGIILFETYNYGGQSQNFVDSGIITDIFPVKQDEGISSLHVMEGTWELLTKAGGKIVVDGKSQFEPGFCSDIPYPTNDRTYSIKRVR